MAIQEEARSLSSRLNPELINCRQPTNCRQKRRSLPLGLALGFAATVSAMLISSNSAVAFPSRVSQTALINTSLLTVGIYPAVETAQISSNADHNSWLYQGIVQLSYAGIIVWVIALLQKSGK